MMLVGRRRSVKEIQPFGFDEENYQSTKMAKKVASISPRGIWEMPLVEEEDMMMKKGELLPELDFDFKMFENDGGADFSLFTWGEEVDPPMLSNPPHQQTYTHIPVNHTNNNNIRHHHQQQQPLPESKPTIIPSQTVVVPTTHINDNLSPKSMDKRKRYGMKKTGTVVSTIKSNRAKPAQIIECKQLPKKNNRIKGVVYVVGDNRKKWDGRQWRRLCIVHDCCSAARGATDFCIVHGRGEVTKTIIENQEVEVVCSNGQPKSVIANAAAAAVASQNTVGIKRKAINEKFDKTQTKYSKTQQCQFVTALGDTCGNMINVSPSSNTESPYCYSCKMYAHATP